MSESDAKVEFVSSEDSKKKQFGRGLFFVQDGKKWTVTTKRVFFVIALAFPVIAVFLLLKDESAKPKAADTVETPGGVAPGPSVGIPEMSNGARTVSRSESRFPRLSILSGPEIVGRPRRFNVPPGSMMTAKLISGASNGPVRAELTEDLVVNGETMIGEGSILLGSGQSTEERLFIRFTKLVFKNGISEQINAQALDGGDKIAGLKGSKIGNYATKLSAGVGLNFVGGLSQGFQDTEVESGAVKRPPTVKNAFLNGASLASLDLAQETMSSLKSQQPIIEVKAGTPILIMVGE